MDNQDTLVKLGRELNDFTYNRDKVLMLGLKKIKFNQPIEKGYFEEHTFFVNIPKNSNEYYLVIASEYEEK